jgi:hypothetical protein
MMIEALHMVAAVLAVAVASGQRFVLQGADFCVVEVPAAAAAENSRLKDVCELLGGLDRLLVVRGRLALHHYLASMDLVCNY